MGLSLPVSWEPSSALSWKLVWFCLGYQGPKPAKKKEYVTWRTLWKPPKHFGEVYFQNPVGYSLCTCNLGTVKCTSLKKCEIIFCLPGTKICENEDDVKWRTLLKPLIHLGVGAIFILYCNILYGIVSTCILGTVKCTLLKIGVIFLTVPRTKNLPKKRGCKMENLVKTTKPFWGGFFSKSRLIFYFCL